MLLKERQLVSRFPSAHRSISSISSISSIPSTPTPLNRLSQVQQHLKPMSFKLLTVATPNGKKVSIFLEELKAAYPGISYECVLCLFSIDGSALTSTRLLELRKSTSTQKNKRNLGSSNLTLTVKLQSSLTIHAMISLSSRPPPFFCIFSKTMTRIISLVGTLRRTRMSTAKLFSGFSLPMVVSALCNHNVSSSDHAIFTVWIHSDDFIAIVT